MTTRCSFSEKFKILRGSESDPGWDSYDSLTSTWSVHPKPLLIKTTAGDTSVINDKINCVGLTLGRMSDFKEIPFFDAVADS